MDQMALFQTEPVSVAKQASLAEQFEAFHAANPQVYEALRERALLQRKRGVRHGSINMLFEVLRWDYSIQTDGGDYKLNNSYRAFYARLLMETEPRLAGWFFTREQHAA